MPLALKVDWSAVKTHCVAHGLPDAAKRFGITQEAIRQRCHREGWKNDPAIAEALAHQGFMSRSVTSAPKIAANAMAESIKDKLLRTRANHVETSLIASAQILAQAETSPQALLDPDTAQVVLCHAKHAALAGGWNDQAPVAKINLSITGIEPNLVEEHIVEAQVVDEDPLASF